MDCKTAREGLWPPERPKLHADEVAEARAHVEGCRECAEYFAQDRALLDLYDRVRTQPAPLEVREKVFESLARARWGAATRAPDSPARGRLWLHVAGWSAAVAASVAIVFFAERGTEPVAIEDDPAVFVEDYLRRAVSQDHIETRDPGEVRRFLQRELGMELGPIQVAGLDLERAEICLLEGRRGAMIVYKIRGSTVSHYLVPREGAEARPPALSDYEDDPVAGMPVVTWSTPRVEQALVGEIGPEELLRLAGLGASGAQ